MLIMGSVGGVFRSIRSCAPPTCRPTCTGRWMARVEPWTAYPFGVGAIRSCRGFRGVPRATCKLSLEDESREVFKDRWSNPLVVSIRRRVELWRDDGYPGVTATTRRLLHHWTGPQR